MLIASLVLSLASLAPVAPEDPPEFGPCPFMNPLTQYVPFDHNPLLWSWNCYLQYKATLTGQIAIYYARIAQCPPGDCACYKAAWERFEQNMREAEIQLVACEPDPEN